MFLHLSVYSQWGGEEVVGQAPPPKLEKWAVRILLECILVSSCLLISSTNYVVLTAHTVILCIKYLVSTH